MSTFVRFDGKNYKLPNALILGRGEPFDIADRSLARAHARLVHRKGKWKIKDLDSECGIKINERTIKPGKFLPVKPGDKILLGDVPFEIHESFAEGDYTEVKNFSTHDAPDFAPFIYGGLLILGGIIAWSETNGDHKQDLIFLALVAAFLKGMSMATRALRVIYFPVEFVKELNLTYEGATFHTRKDKNFSVHFEDVSKWYIVGKCFFIYAYKQKHIYILNTGHEEFATLLKQKCSKKRAPGEPILEKLALLPFIFTAVGVALVMFTNLRFFHFMGHAMGLLGIAGMSAFYFSEHLRELLPFWGNRKAPKNFIPITAIAIVGLLLYHFTVFVGQYRATKFKKELAACTKDNSCGKKKFKLQDMTLTDDDANLLGKLCKDGNQTACSSKLFRKPASENE